MAKYLFYRNKNIMFLSTVSLPGNNLYVISLRL